MEAGSPTIGPPITVAVVWVLTIGAVALFALSARRLVGGPSMAKSGTRKKKGVVVASTNSSADVTCNDSGLLVVVKRRG